MAGSDQVHPRLLTLVWLDTRSSDRTIKSTEVREYSNSASFPPANQSNATIHHSKYTNTLHCSNNQNSLAGICGIE